MTYGFFMNYAAALLVPQRQRVKCYCSLVIKTMKLFFCYKEKVKTYIHMRAQKGTSEYESISACVF